MGGTEWQRDSERGGMDLEGSRREEGTPAGGKAASPKANPIRHRRTSGEPLRLCGLPFPPP